MPHIYEIINGSSFIEYTEGAKGSLYFQPKHFLKPHFTWLHHPNFQLNPAQSIEWFRPWLPSPLVLCLSMMKSFSPGYLQVMNLLPRETIVFPTQPVNSHLSLKTTPLASPDSLSSHWLLSLLNPDHFLSVPLNWPLYHLLIAYTVFLKVNMYHYLIFSVPFSTFNLD